MLQHAASLVAAAVFLALSLATFGWGTRAAAIGHRHTILVFAWLCAALSTSLIIFSLFPAATASGEVFGMTLSGAGAFVLLVWTAALRATVHAARRDAEEAQRATAGARAAALEHQQTYLFGLARTLDGGARRVGVVTGDIRRVRGVDAWVNPENTDMMMARVHENSVSASIRYEGAALDDSGRVVADLVADALARAVRHRRPVVAGTAVVAEPGELTRRNGVRCLIHTAAVQGEPGIGYRAVRDLGRTVGNALRAAEERSERGPRLRSILFPLLGAGIGGADVGTTARTLILAAVDHLASSRAAGPSTVLFLAYTAEELTACLAVLRGCAALRPLRPPDELPGQPTVEDLRLPRLNS
ncbi:macro domain-containing protein [Dactylosporangium sp. NPDC048998]|uniref:macro domain-containing protein n=1 Tax=Dactylosporangium sp. NPDC048998 TaxID=3363976 RepID=UPI0037199694